MNAPWFHESYAFLPGVLLGVLGGVLGGLAGWLAPQGRSRPIVMGGAWALLVASGVLLAAGLAAWSSGQPYGVWYGLGLAGLIGVVVIGANLPVIARAYRAAEERRMHAEDVRL